MRTRASLLAAVLVAFGLGLFNAGAPLAQTETRIDVRNFEVLAVDGNRLIYRDERGAQELTVPDGFRFKVDGRQMSIKELKPGMKGQATITKKTTITPVTVTEFRDAVVVSVSPTGMSVTIRGNDGVRRRFTQSELDKRGIEMIKDGRVVRVSQLNAGDLLTATLISNEPPTVLTETEVDMKLAQAQPAPDKKPSAAPVSAASAPATAVAQGAAPATAASAPATAAQDAAPAAAASDATPPQQSAWLLWVVVLIALAALVTYLVRRKR